MSEPELYKALIGFVLGIVGTYVGLHWKIRKELAAQYDKELRSDRLKCYLALWKHTEILANYSPPGPVTFRSVACLSVELRSWYFGVGGIFFSENARDAYFALQTALTTLHPTPGKTEDSELNPDSLSALRKVASNLRTALTADVGSRSKPLLPNQEVA